MRKIVGILLFIAVSFSLIGQQLPQYTLYSINDFAINPAIAGSRYQTEIKSNNRYQWGGITDNPRTYTLTAHTATPNERIGYGGLLYTDITGPSRRIGIQGAFAYHLKLNESTNISLAISAGLLEYSLDGHKIDLEEESDPALLNALGTSLMFDAKAGIYLYTDKYYFGIATPQIVENELEIYDDLSTGQSITEAHFMAHGGYKYQVNEDFMLEPSILFKYVEPTPLVFDGSLRIHYRDIVWIGGNYRTEDAISAMIGCKLQDRIIFAYSHDFTQSKLQTYSSGTHEIMLGLLLPKQKAKQSVTETE